MKRLLVVAAHPDDGELGAAGLILNLKKVGWTVNYAVFAGTGYDDQKKLMRELEQACKLMEINEKTIYTYPKHKLPDHYHKIRADLTDLEQTFKPNLVLIPSLNDTHQDHITVATESMRTFRNKETILSYEILRHGSYLFKPNVFVDIEQIIHQKVEVLKCYKTQLAHRRYFSEAVFRSIARMRGAQVGIDYAEAFEAVKIFWNPSQTNKCSLCGNINDAGLKRKGEWVCLDCCVAISVQVKCGELDECDS